jgi:hypothetical protein
MPTQKTVDPAEVHSIKQELSRENTLDSVVPAADDTLEVHAARSCTSPQRM